MNPRELFTHTLAELLTAEEALADSVLPELLEQVQEKHFREAVEKHLEQTRGHIEKLERVFGEIGEKPRREPAPALDALRRQHEALVAKVDAGPLRDLFNASSAAHTEHYEISAYHSVITLATLLGEPDAVKLLEQNLHEEEETLEKLEKAIPERLTGELAPA